MIPAAVSEQFEGVVAPACLRKGLFTVGALDNLDHNPSSTAAVNAFHGTGISFPQWIILVKVGLWLHYHLVEANSITYLNTEHPPALCTLLPRRMAPML